jgi:hypothetical protein
MVNTLYLDGGADISADGLTLYFYSTRPGGLGDVDIWVMTRATTDDEWSAPVNLGEPVNTAYHDAWMSMSADGLSLFIDSTRPGGSGDWDLWVTTRATTEHDWATPVNLGPTVNSLYFDATPSISADGLSLFFESNRPGGPGGWADLWVTTRTSVSDLWGTPVNLGPTVNSAYGDGSLSISADGLSLYFGSDRPGGEGGWDVWVTKRATISDPWGTPVNLGPPVNTSSTDHSQDFSADGSTLYFSSYQPGGYGDRDIWQVSITPIVDFNGDGIVDCADMCIMVDHWGENYSLCDIGPTPLGDGIVDVQDLIVLAEHLFTYPGTVAHWRLDEIEGDTAYDSAGDCNGTLVGDPVWQPDGGMVAGALQFDGTNDYVSTEFVLDPADGAFSIFTWIKGGSPGQAIISQTDGLNWLCVDASEGNLMTELRYISRGGSGAPLVSQTPITDDVWHRVGLSWDGTNRSLYVDDVEVASDTQTNLASSGGGLHIGTGKNREPGTFWSGLIDDVRIYNRAVTP